MITIMYLRIFALLGLICCLACLSSPLPETGEITNKNQLIGGPGTLGETGDYFLKNDRVIAVVQNIHAARGQSFQGGTLIDLDLIRNTQKKLDAINEYDLRVWKDQRNVAGGYTHTDHFNELIPMLFLTMMKPKEVEILAPKSKNNTSDRAKIIISGETDHFLKMAEFYDQIIFDMSETEFEIEYSVGPGEQYVTIVTRIINAGPNAINFPSISSLAFGKKKIELPAPVGDGLLFGRENKAFIPGEPGFNIKLSIDKMYENPEIQLPALPGLLADFIATRGNGVSYGYAVKPSENNYAKSLKQYYPTANDSSILVPLSAFDMLGAFAEQPPKVLESGELYEFTRYVLVGYGDVGSIRDVYHDIRDDIVGTLSAKVIDPINEKQQKNAGIRGLSIVVYDSQKKPISQYTTDMNGNIVGNLLIGDYYYNIISDAWSLKNSYIPFSIEENKTTKIIIMPQSPASIVVNVNDSQKKPLPAKITVVQSRAVDEKDILKKSWEYLFDPASGEHFRYSMIDHYNPKLLHFIEKISFTQQGNAQLMVRPGDYQVYVSRGPEYDVEVRDVSLKSEGNIELSIILNKTVDTDNYISSDFHVHSIHSPDSDVTLFDRVKTLASEGVEYAVATDHNIITDYAPWVEFAQLQAYISTSVGLEVTTFEQGHFNGWPLEYDAKPIHHGAFYWYGLTPDQMFDEIRSRGKYGNDNTIVQVNHPRDSITGYFNQYDLDTLTATNAYGKTDIYDGKDFSWDFDAMEVMNGKRNDLVRSYRIPEAQNLPTELPDFYNSDEYHAGQILLKPDPAKIEAAFPGVVDDWFHILNHGNRITATGNSDSHHITGDEVGYPRTYVHVKEDVIGKFNEHDVTRGIFEHRAMVTNGPFVTVYVNDKTIGDTVQPDTLNGEIVVMIEVGFSNWIEVDMINVYQNGDLSKSYNLHKDPIELTREGSNKLTLRTVLYPSNNNKDISDYWFVVEVTGNKPLWPVVPGIEIPPTNISQIMMHLVGDLLGGNDYKDLQPKTTFQITPYAITNPIWIDSNRDGVFTSINSFEPSEKHQKAVNSQGLSSRIEEQFERF